MKKIEFGKSTPLTSILLNVFVGLCISIFTIGISFFVLEAYFENYYTSAKGIPQTAMHLPIYENSDFRSWNHKPGAQAEHGFGTPTPKISINSIGLRNDEVGEKNRTRYLMLGDSFTFGMGVDQSKAFPQRLQQFFGEKYHEVINGGIIGQTVDDVFMYLKHEGVKLKPDYVIYNFFVGNDVTELRRHEWEQDENENILSVKDTVLHADEKNRLRHREEKAPDSYFLFWLNQRIDVLKSKYGYGSPSGIDPTLTWPVFLADDHEFQDENLEEYWWQFEQALKQMNDFCKQNGITFIVSIIPMDTQVSTKYWKKYPGLPFDDEAFVAQRPQKRMEYYGRKHGIAVFDLLPYIQAAETENNEDFYFENDPHFNVLGHRFTASFLWKFLMDNYLR